MSMIHLEAIYQCTRSNLEDEYFARPMTNLEDEYFARPMTSLLYNAQP